MTQHNLFYYPYASFTNAQLPLLKVAALWFDKLFRRCYASGGGFGRAPGRQLRLLDTALVHGVNGLRGAQVMATDLRASVSLIIAGLAAKGETLIGRVYHLDRGFDRLEEKLRKCGAQVDRLSD